MTSFLKFIEQEESDSTSPPIPGSNDTETHNDSRVLSKELGISDEDAAEADQCKTYLCHEKIEFPDDGVVLSPPIDVRVEPIDDSMFKMNVLATNPRKIQDMNGNDYTGKKKEFTKDVSKEFVEALKSQVWTTVGQAQPGMPGMGSPLGGPPMMSHTEYPTFSNWVQLRETGTSTGDVATFSRMTIPLVRRTYPNVISKKKPYQQPQVES